MPLDCLIIGRNSRNHTRSFNRPSLSRYNRRELIRLDGHLLDPLEALSYARAQGGAVAAPYYCLDEVPNLGPVFLASALARQGLQVRWTSHFEAELDRIAGILDRDAPRAVAVTTTCYTDPLPIVEVVQFIRRHNRQTRIVIGGPAVVNLGLRFEGETLSRILGLLGGDIYVLEDGGEKTLARVLRALRDSGDVGAIPNLYLPAAGGFRCTGVEPEDRPVDDDAVDWERFSPEELGRTVHMRTSRGCPFACAFCDRNPREGGVALASLPVVERQLRQLSRLGVKNIFFIDKTFNAPEGRLEDICRMMLRNRFDFNWYSYLRCDRIGSDSLCALMSQSGCKGALSGVESGDQGMLDAMNKDAELDGIRRGMELLDRHGIVNVASMVVGFPGETAESIERSIAFINETAPPYFKLYLWRWDPSSPVSEDPARHGLQGAGLRWRHRTMDWKTALDACDHFYLAARNSLYTTNDLGPWSFPYLIDKGFSGGDIAEMHRILRDLFDQNHPAARLPGPPEAAGRRFLDFCRGLDLSGTKYHISPLRSVLDEPAFAGTCAAIRLELMRLYFAGELEASA
ncbi:MAG: radical SAM protein [Elusimicrobia bacterium]|nr:radical SAM protein [Elusimicrobiota bacterium]